MKRTKKEMEEEEEWEAKERVDNGQYLTLFFLDSKDKMVTYKCMVVLKEGK